MSGYKFYFHLLGSTGCQLDVAQPRALTLSLEKCTTINYSPSLPQCVGRLVLLSSFFICPHSSIISSPSVSLTGIWIFLYPPLSYPLLDLSFSLPWLFLVSCVPLVLLISIFLFLVPFAHFHLLENSGLSKFNGLLKMLTVDPHFYVHQYQTFRDIANFENWVHSEFKCISK